MRKGCALGVIMLIMTVFSITITLVVNGDNFSSKRGDDEVVVVTSFYPVYIAAANVLDGADNVRLQNLTDNHGGCLHDYQITTEDMRKLSEADIFIINGAGMEGFVEDIIESCPELTVIDTSEDIELLDAAVVHSHESDTEERVAESAHEHETELVHEHEEEYEHGTEPVHEYEEEHEHGAEPVHEHEEEHIHDKNGHIWMNPEKYRQQIVNIVQGMQEADSGNASLYEKNGQVYCDKILHLEEELQDLCRKCTGEHAVIFHDAFSYLAQYLDMEVVYAVELEEDTSLSAGEVAEIIDTIKESNVQTLFSEEQFQNLIPESIAKETNTDVCVINTLVTGEFDTDAYIRGMEENIANLEKAMERH